jgi:hypothetical protein
LIDHNNPKLRKPFSPSYFFQAFSKSPDNLLGVTGEEGEYKWKFKMDEGFQPSSSFTHLPQLKAVDGSEDGMPSITLTT